MTDLSQIFAAGRTNQIRWNGIDLCSTLEIKRPVRRLCFEFVSYKASPPQGIRVQVRHGTLTTAGATHPDMALWVDNAPRKVAVDVEATKRGRGPLVSFWNIWRVGGDDRIVQAWLGNAAIRVDGDEQSPGFLMCCSDGEGDVDFHDLVVFCEVDYV